MSRALILAIFLATTASAFSGPERPLDGSDFVPCGIGPVSRGFLGSVWGVFGAPVAFAVEAAQAVVLTPVRMVRAALAGDRFFIFEPARTAKNLIWDSICVAAGAFNCALGPLWNIFRPDERADFSYAHNRLIFYGGPIAGLIKDTGYARAMAPSWHTVFITQEFGRPWLGHEFVHNRQIGRSFLAERVGEDYKGFKGWRAEDRHEYLNW